MGHLIRTCIGCGKTDDHPRIVLASTTPGSVHDTDATWHHDCWVLAHEDDGSDRGVTEMHKIVEHAGGKKGDDLRAYLLSPEHREFKARFEAEFDAQLVAEHEEHLVAHAKAVMADIEARGLTKQVTGGKS